MVEAVFIAPVLVALVSGLLVIGYLCLAKVWLSHVLYEEALCLASETPPRRCRHQARQALEAALPVGTLQTHSARKSEEAILVSGQWQVPGDHSIRIRHRIALPLSGAPPSARKMEWR